MAHRIERRDLTGDERRIAAPPRFPPALGALPASLMRFALMLVFCFAVLMAFAGIVVPVTMKLDWNPTMPGWMTPVLIVVLWGPVILVPMVTAVRGYRRRYRNATARLRDAQGQVEIIAVSDAPFFTLVGEDERSTYLFDLDGKTLLIEASSLELRHELFGLPSIAEYLDDREVEDDGELADLPRVPFPNSDFVLHRLPHSGRILSIELKGEGKAPSRLLLSNEVPPLQYGSRARGEPIETALIDASIERLLGAQVSA